MKAIGYARVSTDGQAVDGVSLDAQKARIAAWAQANDVELVNVYTDAGLSGGRADNRPALRDALADACRRKCAIVVYSLSRLSRSIADTLAISERLGKAGADLVSLTEKIDTTSAAGRMIFNMLSVLSQFEREQIGERTAAAMQHMRRQGKRISRHAPYGFNLAGENLVRNDAEQAILSRMKEMKATGQSLRQIAAALNAQGIPPKMAATWSMSSVRDILNRAA